MAETPTTESPMAETPTVTDYLVTGMTCGHCVASVIEEVSLITGVSAVSVDLVTGAASTVHVTSAGVPAAADIRAAIDEAGYELQEPATTSPATSPATGPAA